MIQSNADCYERQPGCFWLQINGCRRSFLILELGQKTVFDGKIRRAMKCACSWKWRGDDEIHYVNMNSMTRWWMLLYRPPDNVWPIPPKISVAESLSSSPIVEVKKSKLKKWEDVSALRQITWLMGSAYNSLSVVLCCAQSSCGVGIHLSYWISWSNDPGNYNAMEAVRFDGTFTVFLDWKSRRDFSAIFWVLNWIYSVLPIQWVILGQVDSLLFSCIN